MYTASRSAHIAARRKTCSIIGRPRIRARGLPGKRDEPIRAGIIAMTRVMALLRKVDGKAVQFAWRTRKASSKKTTQTGPLCHTLATRFSSENIESEQDQCQKRAWSPSFRLQEFSSLKDGLHALFRCFGRLQ